MTNWAYESWQLEQLGYLAVSDPERVSSALKAFWEANPELFNDAILSAVDRRQISYERASELLDLSVAEINKLLEAQRSNSASWEQFIEVEAENGTARLSDSHVPIWEIIREYRKLGSVDSLCEAFPQLTQGSLAAALKYAEAHSTDIQSKIDAYEQYLDRRKAIIQSAAS